MAIRTPRLDPVSLSDLTDADLDDLLSGDRREGERYARAELSGRTLPDIEFFECAFDAAAIDGLSCRGARFIDCTLAGADGAVISAPSASLRDVELSHSRIGSAELYDNRWDRVRISGCKLGYVNLRGSVLSDVVFEDCQIDELDLGQATASRVTLAGCRVDTLDVSLATLRDVDLRGIELSRITGIGNLSGAVVDELQLTRLAPLLAAHLGLTVV